MYKRILLAFDGSPEGHEALHQGVDMARLCGAQVCLMAVVDPTVSTLPAQGMTFAIECQRRVIEAVLQAGLALLREQGLTARAQLRYGNPAEQIRLCAHEMASDLIVVGHRDQNAWARWWNGSVSSSVLDHAPCSLLVAIGRARVGCDEHTDPGDIDDRFSNVVSLPRYRRGRPAGGLETLKQDNLA